MRAILLLGIAVVGCRDEMLEELRAIRTEVCACHTMQCGETALAKLPQTNVRSDHEAQALANEMLDCMARIRVRERPTADPDEPVPTSPQTSDPASARTP